LEQNNLSPEVKKSTALIFPELLFLNDLILLDNLKLYFEATKREFNSKRTLKLLDEFDLIPSQKINELTLLQKLDFLICRGLLINAKLFVIDSSILQLKEYDQDRLMAYLIMHCRKSGASLVMTQFSERVDNLFPGRVVGSANKEEKANRIDRI